MHKQIVFLVLILFGLNGNAQSKKPFPELLIIHTTSGCYYEQVILQIVPNAFGYNAIMANPYESNCITKDSIWVVEIDSNALLFLQDFLNEAKKHHKNCKSGDSVEEECWVVSSDSNFRYSFYYNRETSKINKIDFTVLVNILFQKEFKRIETTKNQIKSRLHGKWLVKGITSEPFNGDSIFFHRIFFGSKIPKLNKNEMILTFDYNNNEILESIDHDGDSLYNRYQLDCESIGSILRLLIRYSQFDQFTTSMKIISLGSRQMNAIITPY